MVIPIKITGLLLYALISYVAVLIFLTAVTNKGLNVRFFKGAEKFVGGFFAKILGFSVFFLLILVLVFSSQTSGLSQLKFWAFVVGGFFLGIAVFVYKNY